MTGGDVKPLLSNLVIPSRMHWISDEENSGIESSTQWIIEEMFKRIRKEISEAVPVLLVAGSVSSGKSSLLNVLLGEEILPVSHNATTTVLCELKFSNGDGKKMAVVHFDEGSMHLDLKDEQDREKFRQYANNRRSTTSMLGEAAMGSGDQSTAHFCKRIEIFWPMEFLKDMVLIDSPGAIDDEDIWAMRSINEQCRKAPCGYIFVLDAVKSAQEAAKAGGLLRYILRATSTIPAPGSALFVVNKWDLVESNEKGAIRLALFEKLAEEWPGFHKHQMITMSCVQSAGALRAGSVSPDIEPLCRGIENALASGSDHTYLSVSRYCLDLVELISGSVEQTICSFNMPRDKRLTKWREEWERCEKQRQDYEHGQLRKQHQFLLDKIKETAEALNVKLKSVRQCQSIIEQAKVQSEHEGFFACHKGDKDCCGVEQFAGNCLLQAITEAEEYKKVKQWATDELMVERACYDIGIPLSEIDRNYLAHNSRIDLQVKYVKERFNWAFFVLHFLFLAPINLPGMVWYTFTQFKSEAALKMVPSVQLTNLAEQTSFVSSVIDTYSETLRKLGHKENQELKILLQKFLIRDVRGVRILMDDVPRHIKETRNKLEAQANREEKDKGRFETIFQNSGLIRKKLAATVLKLNVHVWLSDSVHMSHLSVPVGNYLHFNSQSFPNGSFHDVTIETGSKLVKNSTLLVIDLKDESLSDTVALAVVLPRMKLEHPKVLSVYGSVLLDSDDMKIGLLYERYVSQPITEELFARNRELENAFQIALSISDAICYMHNADIILRGFSLENIKMSANGAIKLLPPPYGKQLWDLKSCLDGPFHHELFYAAPEVLYHWICDRAADIYSIGILLAELWAGHHTYSIFCKTGDQFVPSKTAAEFVEDIGDKKLRPNKLFQSTQGKPIVGSEESIKLARTLWHNLADDCWQSDPPDRPKAEEVKKRLLRAAAQAQLHT